MTPRNVGVPPPTSPTCVQTSCRVQCSIGDRPGSTTYRRRLVTATRTQVLVSDGTKWRTEEQASESRGQIASPNFSVGAEKTRGTDIA
jgi:hypothetical protein